MRILAMWKETWEGFVKFLKEYDAHKIADVISQIKWENLLGNPVTWIVGVPILGFIVWKRMFRLLLLCVSFVLLIVLLQYTSPRAGEYMSLNKLLTFLGGAVVLIAVNAYFLLIRQR
jgi:putative effector of murein hydrolase